MDPMRRGAYYLSAQFAKYNAELRFVAKYDPRVCLARGALGCVKRIWGDMVVRKLARGAGFFHMLFTPKN
jgi:hypothetical protein